jgi:hypothetical protein
MAGEQRRGIDLERGPAIRARLVTLASQEHALLLTSHRMMLDRRSLEMSLYYLHELYSAFAQGHGPPLPELPIDYGDYAAWQRAWLSGAKKDQCAERWNAYLLTHERETVHDGPAASITVQLSAQLSTALVRQSQILGVTPYTALLSAFVSTLAETRGKRVITVGVPSTGRGQWQTRSALGLFETLLAVSVDAGEQSSASLVEQTERRVREAYELSVMHVEALDSCDHLFDTVFGWRDALRAFPDAPGELQWEWLRTEPVEIGYAMVVMAGMQADGAVTLDVTYSRAAFDAGAIEDFRRRYLGLLESFTKFDSFATGVSRAS